MLSVIDYSKAEFHLFFHAFLSLNLDFYSLVFFSTCRLASGIQKIILMPAHPVNPEPTPLNKLLFSI